jgi:eukaryotic-like serine/threonine-protein kinase
VAGRGTTEVVAGRYHLEEVIGRGGWGRVWRARDGLLGRDVAVKEVTVPEDLGTDRRTVEERVLREARAAARIPHPGAVTVFDVVRHQDRTFIVMELLRGRSLSAVVAEDGPLDPERAATIAADVLDTLRAAHAQGIVHRDIKPGNVMISDDGRVRLTDFGIATARDQSSLTLTGQVLGSPQFMAPEQARGERASPATDLWGLGATLFHAVEGRPPFGHEHPLATLNAVVNEPTPRAPNAGPLAPVIEALLQKDPAARPDVDRAEEMLRDVPGRSVRVQRAEEEPVDDAAAVTVADLFDREESEALWPPPEEPVHAPSLPEPEQHVREPEGERRSAPWAAILLGVAILAVAGLFVLLTTLDTPPQESREQAPASEASPEEEPADQGAEGETTEASPSPEATPAFARWSRYRDPAVGYRIRYPEGWEVAQLDATRTDFRDPESGTLVRVDWTDQPGPDPVAAWESYSQDFAADHEGYQEIRIDPAEFQGYSAAEWEFTYVEGGTTLHAIDLGFVTGDFGFALFMQAPEDEWADMQDEFEAFKASFRAPS